jgi:hypothetical protein
MSEIVSHQQYSSIEGVSNTNARIRIPRKSKCPVSTPPVAKAINWYFKKANSQVDFALLESLVFLGFDHPQ